MSQPLRPHTEQLRKIIHIDMDCFYAAIEVRDNPLLTDKPVAVGGPAHKRGVICTCNYVARQYGVRSAMATATAYRHCKDLIVLPVNMPKYRQVAKQIQDIFKIYTKMIEPLALDEAYLDVTDTSHHHGSATLIAKAIRQQIWQTEKLTASAGVAPNKFLAKIASGWKKPNGLFVIRPNEIASFVKSLPIEELYGVGKITAGKLRNLGLKTCTDLQRWSLTALTTQFGKLGQHLYEQCRGIDYRQVEPDRTAKSLSVEQTFPQDISNIDTCLKNIDALYHKLNLRLAESAASRLIKNQYIKIKFNNFKLITAEISSSESNLKKYLQLFQQSYAREQKPVRLLGLGVHFYNEALAQPFLQATLF